LPFLLGKDFGSVKCIVTGSKMLSSSPTKDYLHLNRASIFISINPLLVKSHDTYTVERDEFDGVICRTDIQSTSIKGTVSYWHCSSAITWRDPTKETSWLSVLSFSKADVDLEVFS
jgi:hypothetical protein